MRFLHTAGARETRIPSLDRASVCGLFGPRDELMPPESGEGPLESGRQLIPPKGVVDVGPCQAVWGHGTEHLQDLIRHYIAQGVPKNVGDRCLTLLPERQR